MLGDDEFGEVFIRDTKMVLKFRCYFGDEGEQLERFKIIHPELNVACEWRREYLEVEDVILHELILPWR